MTDLKLQKIIQSGMGNAQAYHSIESDKKRKAMQFIGEGVTFLVLILAGAMFVFRAVRRQFRQSQEQHNFMMGITHELKTPIAVTKLNLETLVKHSLDPAQQKKLIANTIQEANRLNDLCNNMLLTSQIESGSYTLVKEDINFSEMVNSCINDFIIRYPERSIESDIDNDVFVIGDLLLLQMAVNNLLDNALKYSNRDGVVSVNLKMEQERVSLSVKDEGKGVKDDEKEKIFNKYYRSGNQHTKEARGTGLGLFLTKNIIRQHRGIINVYDNQPHGSIFTFVI